MKQLYTKEEIKEMRTRLYSRGSGMFDPSEHSLTDTPIDVSRDWVPNKDGGPRVNKSDSDSGEVSTKGADNLDSDENEVSSTRKHSYRSFVLIGSILIFFFVAVISSLFLYLGKNQVSNDNIQVSVQGPSAVSGGEVTPFQVSVVNNNTVVLESVTLIVKYPQGTRSVGDSPRNLFEERISLEDIAPNEVRDIPLEVAIFGEENDEKSIESTIEYRVNGSNSFFYKDSEQLSMNVISSPLVLRVDSIKKVASGQLVDVTLTAVSNASTPLKDIIITASYPNGFSYESSSPEPVYGQNVWQIDELLPTESTSIKLNGVISGLLEESFHVNFKAGPANPDNQYLVGATLAETQADFTIEKPFISVKIAINGDSDLDAILPEEGKASIKIDIKNTLDETVYDMAVEVIPGGNALDEDSIRSTSGFYDSNRDAIRWEVANNSSFDKVLPGDSRSLTLDLKQGQNRTTASFDVVVNVYARRVAETSAQETLIGSTRAEGKYSSSISLGSQVGRNVGRFGDSGPVPPVAEELTTYSLTLVATAGANDMANAIVQTSLPLYVDWLDSFDVDGEVEYNSVSKKIQWEIGDISSGQQKELTFQVSILPSTSQINRIPILMNGQSLRANDRFTGALLQDSAPAVTTELSTEMGFQEENGMVRR